MARQNSDEYFGAAVTTEQQPLSADASRIELTILMPCLNEAETVADCVAEASGYLARKGARGEVLVADNGSSDGSQQLAQAAGARVINVGERGYGAALRGGIEAAHGRYVIMGDADGSYDFSDLDLFMDKLRQGVDLVIGNRFRGGIAAGAMPFLHRYLGNPVLSFIGRLFFKAAIRDFHCGLRGFNRERFAALNLHTTGMEFASEMIIAAVLGSYSISEVPTVLRKDKRSHPPHLRSWRDGWRHLRFLLLFSPRWLFVYPGLALMAFGLILAVLLFPGSLEIADGVELDIHTFIVGSIALLLGLQSICFGILTRRFAITSGFLPPSIRYGGILDTITLERGLVVGGLIAMAGIVGMSWSVLKWAAVGFGPLQYPMVMRVLVLSLTGIAAGIQLMLCSFLAAILDLPVRRDRGPRQQAAGYHT